MVKASADGGGADKALVIFGTKVTRHDVIGGVAGLLASKAADTNSDWRSWVPKVFSVYCDGCPAGLARKFWGDRRHTGNERLTAGTVKPELWWVCKIWVPPVLFVPTQKCRPKASME